MFAIYNDQFLTIHLKRTIHDHFLLCLMNELPGANFPGMSALLLLDYALSQWLVKQCIHFTGFINVYKKEKIENAEISISFLFFLLSCIRLDWIFVIHVYFYAWRSSHLSPSAQPTFLSNQKPWHKHPLM